MNHTSPKQIGDYNKNQVLTILREKGPASRIELSRLLEISATAVTRNTSKLLTKGIIRECGAEHSILGRKPVLMELCGDFCYVIGVDIVGGTLKVALADLMGTIIKYNEEPVKFKQGAQAVAEQLIAASRSIIQEAEVPPGKVWVITVGTPGIFNSETGKSRFTFFLDGWDEIDIRSKVSNELAIETLIENDVNLDLVGESWKGVGRNYENILYVKLGQGLAARIVLNNKLLRGNNRMAGEIGYMLPGLSFESTDNYENLLCNDSVSRKYREFGGSEKINGLSGLLALKGRGDYIAEKVINYVLDLFAVVLLNSNTVLDPQVIILGGDASSFDESQIALLKEKIEKYLPLVQNIIPSKLDKKACLYGAIKTGLDRVEERITDIW